MRLVTVPGVFRPRSDSLMLARRVAGEVEPESRVLDAFTGSGVLAITAARAGARATAVDISRRAVACARLNARLNGVRVSARRGDLFGPVRGQRFELIVANPPYLPSVDDAPPRGAARAWDAGPDGRGAIRRLCREAPAHLLPGGRLLMIHSSICDPGATFAELEAAGFECEVLERHRGPLGPLLTARAPMLERRGLLAAGEREEELLVIAATRPVARVVGAEAGSAAACPRA